MNKLIISLLFIHIAFIGLTQDRICWKYYVQDSTKEYKWANQINRIVSPRYVLLNKESHPFYKEIRLSGQELVIVAVLDTTKRYRYGTTKNKIIVFSIRNNKLHIVDSSAEYETDSRNPQIDAYADSLIVINIYTNNGDNIIYKWNRAINKYLLSSINHYSSDFYTKKGLNYIRNHNKTYDVTKQTLTIETEEPGSGTEKEGKTTNKIIHKKLPANISLKLKDMKDPSDYETLF